MVNILKANKKIFIILILFFIGILTFFINKSYSYQSLYDILPENSVIVGRKVFEGQVNPNHIANAAIEHYIENNNDNVKIYKYSGLDINGYPIWGTYSDEKNSYAELSSEEIQKIENILKEKYNLG